jgi:hypothetical protein
MIEPLNLHQVQEYLELVIARETTIQLTYYLPFRFQVI